MPRFLLKTEGDLRHSALKLEQIQNGNVRAFRKKNTIKLDKTRQQLMYRLGLTEEDGDGIIPLSLERYIKVINAKINNCCSTKYL